MQFCELVNGDAALIGPFAFIELVDSESFRIASIDQDFMLPIDYTFLLDDHRMRDECAHHKARIATQSISKLYRRTGCFYHNRSLQAAHAAFVLAPIAHKCGPSANTPLPGDVPVIMVITANLCWHPAHSQ